MLEPQDRCEINDLYAQYCHRIDTGDAEGWADLFTDDATWELLDQIGGSAVWGINGRQGLIQMAREEYRSRGNGKGRHWVSNILIDGSVPNATGSCYGLLLQSIDNRMQILAHGNFCDEFVKLDAGWRFKSRKCAVTGDAALS